MKRDEPPTDLARLLQRFFCERLIQQRRASPQTVSSYRDTFRLLLRFAEQHLGKTVNTLCLANVDVDLILAFLDHLESQRHNGIRSRNARLAAIRAFLHYAALQEPSALVAIQRILAIPMKRFDRPQVGFLTREEMDAILSATNTPTWSGQRDYALLMTLYNTGARVSEIVGVRRMDVEGDHCAAVHLHGKGRKERVVPLWKRTTMLLRGWMAQIPAETQQSLFPNRHFQAMTRSGVEKRLRVWVQRATAECPSLSTKTVSPHIVRHTTAMHLLQSGVDMAVIALWLGHESVVTTHQYLQADLQMKEHALSALQPPQTSSPRFKPPPELLAFLDAL